MIRKSTSNFAILLIMMISFPIIIPVISETTTTTLGPFFSLSLLTPNTGSSIMSTLLLETLPKIGIKVDVFDCTGWYQIYNRTFSYSGSYPIPSYAEGGYDILEIGWQEGLDFYSISKYHSNSFIPKGDNIYQYESKIMDLLIDAYLASFYLNNEKRDMLARIMQTVFYEDQPSLTILYPASLYSYDINFEGWDGLLWYTDYQSMENWSIPGQASFYYATPYQPMDFHPGLFENPLDAQWLNQIYSALLKRDPLNGRGWSPDLALSYNTHDGLTYIIKLNPAVKWADGVSLNASDVEYSYKLMITPEFNNPDYLEWVQYIDNSSLTIINEFEIEIKFKKNYPSQNNHLGLPLVPKHIWEVIPYANHGTQASFWAKTDPAKIIGAGPYLLYEYDDVNKIIHLKRNDYYAEWSSVTPYFSDIYFKYYKDKSNALVALSSGEVDMVDAYYNIKFNDVLFGTKYELVPNSGVREFALNNKHPYFGTGESCPIPGTESAKHIRKAISHVIPRDIIVEEIMDGLAFPGVTPFPRSGGGFDETLEPYEYSISHALEHMKAAGFDINLSNSSWKVGLSLVIIMTCIISLAGGAIIFSRKKNK